MKYKVTFEFDLTPTSETINFLDQTKIELKYNLDNDFDIYDLMDWFPDFQVLTELID